MASLPPGIERVPDRAGHTMILRRYKDSWTSPQFNEEAMNNMADFPLRADDIILCTYAKSGSHWIWEILRLLVQGTLLDDTLGKEAYMMEWRPSKEYTDLPSPRILNNHMAFEDMPKDLLIKKTKVVFFYRNLKDAAVSFYHHHIGIKEYEYQASFDDFLDRFVDGLVDVGSPFPYLKGWEKGILENPDLPVFIGSYDELKANNFAEVKRLAEFLGKKHSDDFIRQVCDVTSFEKMKAQKGEHAYKNQNGEPVMYRKGQVGDWENHFSTEKNKWFDELIQKELGNSKIYKFRYSM